jgi:hypothetical protein
MKQLQHVHDALGDTSAASTNPLGFISCLAEQHERSPQNEALQLYKFGMWCGGNISAEVLLAPQPGHLVRLGSAAGVVRGFAA